MTAQFIFAEPGDPCRSCSASGVEASDSGRMTSCYHCGGSGLKSVRVQKATTDLIKNTYTEGFSERAYVAGSGGYWSVDDLSFVEAMNEAI